MLAVLSAAARISPTVYAVSGRESALARLDLSQWRVAYSGSEPIRLDTLERFAEKSARCGFTANSFFASYGLAEATLFVAGIAVARHPALRVDEQRWPLTAPNHGGQCDHELRHGFSRTMGC